FQRPHQGLDGLVPADRFFGAESGVREETERTIRRNELAMALGSAPSKPVYLTGRIGDQSVSLHGERGRLVIRTPDGETHEMEMENAGMPRERSENDDAGRIERDGGAGAGEGAPRAAAQEDDGECAEKGADGGEGAVGVGDGGGPGAGAEVGVG